MNLTFVIHDILYKKNFITIPNFGSFISQYQSARIIKSDFVRFIPPHKTINFNPEILQNDGILEQILCDDYQLSPEHAQLEIQAFVNTSKDILDKTNLLLLEGIGSFTLDDKGNINFSPNQEINYLTHSFGLSDFTIQELAQEKILEEFIQKKKEQTQSLGKKIGKTLLIASPLILGIILIPNILQISHTASITSIFRETTVEIDNTTPVKPKPILSEKKEIVEIKTPVIINQQNNSEKQSLETNKKTITKTKDVITPYVDKASNYYIIIGSFSRKKQAEIALQKIKTKNSKSGILSKDDKNRVYIYSAQTKKECLDQLESIKVTAGFKDAWILSNI